MFYFFKYNTLKKNTLTREIWGMRYLEEGVLSSLLMSSDRRSVISCEMYILIYSLQIRFEIILLITNNKTLLYFLSLVDLIILEFHV